mgnify:FL=1
MSTATKPGDRCCKGWIWWGLQQSLHGGDAARGDAAWAATGTGGASTLVDTRFLFERCTGSARYVVTNPFGNCTLRYQGSELPTITALIRVAAAAAAEETDTDLPIGSGLTSLHIRPRNEDEIRRWWMVNNEGQGQAVETVLTLTVTVN